MSDISNLIFAQPPAEGAETFNLLAYGPEGTGKTTAAARMAKFGPILWINCEGAGALAYARKIAGNQNILEVRIDRDTVNVAQTLGDAINHVRSGTDPQPATVVIDTVHKLRSALVRQIGGAQPTQQQWGKVATILKEAVEVLRDLPVNTIWICHEDVADEDGERIVRPLIGGALTQLVPGEMDVEAYTARVQTEGGEQFLGQLVNAKGRHTKDRSGALGPYRPLDFAEWLDAYRLALAADQEALPFDGPAELPDAESAQETLAA